MFLTYEQLTSYNKDGYLIIENFIDRLMIDSVKERIQYLLKNTPLESIQGVFTTEQNDLIKYNDYFINSANQIKIFLEEKAINNGILNRDLDVAINKIAHALHRDTFFSTITHDERIKFICNDLKINEPTIVQSMYIVKPPKIGGRVKIHQDSSYLYTEPLSCIGFWIPIEDVDQENGCMWFMPGSHRFDLMTRFIKNDDNELCYDPPINHHNNSNELFPHELFVPIETKKGSLVIFHGNLLHKSDENLSDKSRHAYSFHVIDGLTKWSEKNWLQYPEHDFFDKL